MNVEMLKENIASMIDDNTFPKTVKSKLSDILSMLQTDEDLDIVVNKAVNIIEEAMEDSNLQQYVRNQLLSLMTFLEMLAS